VPDHVRHFKVTEPSQGSPTTFTSTAVTINQGVVTALEIHMPSGHAGLTGIRVSYGSYQIVPDPPDDFYNGNKRTLRRELGEAYPVGGTWFVDTYNADQHYPHTFYVDFEIDALDLADATLQPVLLLYGDTAGAGVPAGVPPPVGVPGGGGGQAAE